MIAGYHREPAWRIYGYVPEGLENLEVAEIDLDDLAFQRNRYRAWLFIEEALDLLGFKHTEKNRRKVVGLFEFLGWEHVPLRSLPRRPDPKPGEPHDARSLWVRTHSLKEVEELFQRPGNDRLESPLYRLIGTYAGRVRRIKPLPGVQNRWVTNKIHVEKVVSFLHDEGRPVWASEIKEHVEIDDAEWQRLKSYLLDNELMKKVVAEQQKGKREFTRCQYAAPDYEATIRRPAGKIEPYEGSSADLYQVVEDFLARYDEVTLQQVHDYVRPEVSRTTLERVLIQIGWRRRGSEYRKSVRYVSPTHPHYVSRYSAVRRDDAQSVDAPESKEKRDILAVLKKPGLGLVFAKDIADHLKRDLKTVRKLLKEMVEDEEVSVLRSGRGNLYFAR